MPEAARRCPRAVLPRSSLRSSAAPWLDERLDRRVDVVDAGGRVVARRPHQRREAVRVAAVDVDAGLKQQRDNRGVGVAGGVDHRAIARRRRAHWGRRRTSAAHRRSPPSRYRPRRRAGGRPSAPARLGSAPRSSSSATAAPRSSLGGVEQRRRAVDGARVGIGAAFEKKLDQPRACPPPPLWRARSCPRDPCASIAAPRSRSARACASQPSRAAANRSEAA